MIEYNVNKAGRKKCAAARKEQRKNVSNSVMFVFVGSRFGQEIFNYLAFRPLRESRFLLPSAPQGLFYVVSDITGIY